VTASGQSAMLVRNAVLIVKDMAYDFAGAQELRRVGISLVLKSRSRVRFHLAQRAVAEI
jgi:hypothetical protein